MARWNPWRALREQPFVEFTRDLVGTPRGVCTIDGADVAIAIRPDLLRRERAEVVGHELIHLERGILEHPDPVMRRREEECVHDELCRRMIPLDELVPWLVARGDEPTTARDVAEWWDRTPALAGRALRLAKHPSQAWRWRAG